MMRHPTKLSGLAAFLIGAVAGGPVTLSAFDHVVSKIDNSVPADSNGSSSNGRVPLGTNLRGDDLWTRGPTVIKDGATYKMWYTGHDSPIMRVYHATSPDGFVWTKKNNTVPPNSNGSTTDGRVARGTGGRGDDTHAQTPCVILEGATYRMWYAGHDGAAIRIYYATSPDGLTWTKLDNTIPGDSNGSSTAGRVPQGTAGRGDDLHAHTPCVIKDGSTYRMWYAGYDESVWGIYHATSPDGLVWTKVNNSNAPPSDAASTDGRIPVGTTGTGDEGGTFAPAVIKDGSIYRMWYAGQATNDSSWRIYHATSSNALDWTKLDNSLPPATDGIATNGRIALGSDGTGDDVLVVDTAVIKEEAFRLWYGAYDGSRYRIYHATQEAPSPVVSNRWATNIAAVAADLVGNLASTGDAPTEVVCYWGLDDGGTDANAWATTNSLGTNNVGAITNAVAGLAGSTRYYCRFYATNAHGDDWANSTLSFSTDGAPIVDNGGGATNVSRTQATLRGEILGGHPTPTARIFWGPTDGGTTNAAWSNEVVVGSASNWTFATTVTGLQASTTYYYRAHGSNSFGEAWAAATTNFTTPSTDGQIKIWAGTGNWTNHLYWTPFGEPIPNDSVIVESGTVTLSNSVTVVSVAVSNGATISFVNWDTTLTASAVVVQTGGTVTCVGGFTTTSNNVVIACSNLTIDAGGAINLDGKGFRNSNNTISGYGPEPGASKAASGGAGHGGFGGWGKDTASPDRAGPAGGMYDSPVSPRVPGSGGGRSTAVGGSSAGNGGGALYVLASGHVLVNGTITANGESAVTSDRWGGGSGGSIWIVCNTFAGSNGVLQADGGTGKGNAGDAGGGRISVVYDTTAQNAMPIPLVTYSALPGQRGVTDPRAADIGSVHWPDSRFLGNSISNINGQVYGFASWAPDQLIIDNCWIRFPEPGFQLTVTNDVVVKGSSARLELGGEGFRKAESAQYVASSSTSAPVLLVGGDLILTNAGDLAVYAALTNGTAPDYGALVDVASNVALYNGSWIYPDANATNGGAPLFRMSELTIASNAGFNADARGYAGGRYPANGYGPGFGHAADPYGSGAGYGGTGGASSTTSGVGVVYGSTNAPAEPGSGGGGGENGAWAAGFRNLRGARGGGVVRIEVDGTLRLDGTITANGETPTGNGRPWSIYSGAGGGGAIWLTCDVFTGAVWAVLQADGGAGATDSGGGGGGRNAVWYDSVNDEDGARIRDGTFPESRLLVTTNLPTYFGASRADGGGGFGTGDVGSVVFLKVLPPGGTLILTR